ncbi:MAG: anhydro-N-acetylmuramic acid kinase [Sphaerochaeta associata]|uniref:anhydro-N-acetylmuramic acid kinase n=1 Tax=Sphaerochaeta associata TaxID=1129264 RepID=UPI002B202255|nr:anhydro-N-acetylmuramic acid kinase [Sphaerochaeta associata]MEA5105734.1 anhydro-N-acetylmuramic acid kinase [Sphaerochaeta associata]
MSLVIGLMSGTSADGVDAALVRIEGEGESLCLEELAFVSCPYSDQVRSRLLVLAQGEEGGSRELCLMDALLGHLFVEAALEVCKTAGLKPSDISLIGTHGHTFHHIPQSTDYLGRAVRSTLQLGQSSFLSETFGCPVVSDFRPRDLAAGGQGAPLVPYTEYLLFRRTDASIALLNIGGIGNITILPAACSPDEVLAFDTGVGNMVIDELVARYSNNALRYDEGGAWAQRGVVDAAFLSWMEQVDSYLPLGLPKSTGRELYGKAYIQRLLEQAGSRRLSSSDVLATATRFIARSVKIGLKRFYNADLDYLVVGGGGSHNLAILNALEQELGTAVHTWQDFGRDSDSKEAVAFALLAWQRLVRKPNTLPSATGANHSVVMGKLEL